MKFALFSFVIFTQVAMAEIGGYQLYSRQGAAQLESDGFVLTAPEVAESDTNHRTPTPLSTLMGRALPRCETVLESLQLDATSHEKRHGVRVALQDAVAEMLDRSVRVTVKITSVSDHSPPAHPAKPAILLQAAPAIGDWEYKEYIAAKAVFEEQSKRYEAALKDSRRFPFMVAGEVVLSEESRLSAADREKIDQIQRDYTEKVRRYSEYRSAESRRSALLEARKEREQDMERVKTSARSRQAVHMVYVLGGKDQFADWKPGQTRSLVGRVAKAAVFRGGSAGATRIGGRSFGIGDVDWDFSPQAVVCLEFEMQMSDAVADVEAAPEEKITVELPLEAVALIDVAGEYVDQGNTDLAVRLYQKVIEMYPGSAASKVAAQRSEAATEAALDRER